MKHIYLHRIELENFKCHKSLGFTFAYRVTSILGDNATGKTSIYDGLTWLLFGKDSHGNGEKNFEIKPLNKDGEVADHQAITSVTAGFVVDGTEIELKRTYQEVWSTKRGCSEATYDGNTSEYFIDGIPCKKNIFSQKVDEICSEEVFRMLTKVDYFANDMKWQDRRAILFQMTGASTDLEIMQRDPRFIPLMQGVGTRSVADYKLWLNQQKKGYSTTKTQTPARLDEQQRMLQHLASIDFDAIRSVLPGLRASAEELRNQIAQQSNGSAISQKRIELGTVLNQIQELKNRNTLHLQQQTQGAPDIRGMESELSGITRNLNENRRYLERYRNKRKNNDTPIDNLRESWTAEAASVYAGSTLCPCCGQQLPESKIQEAIDAFHADKTLRMTNISQMAAEIKTENEVIDHDIATVTELIGRLEEQETTIRSQIEAARAASVKPSDLEGYNEDMSRMRSQQYSLEAAISELERDSAAALADLRNRLRVVEEEISSNEAQLAQEASRGAIEQRINELRTAAQDAAQNLEQIDSMLYLIEEFTRYKAQCIESDCNAPFEMATFRLFREQANGGVEDRCDVVYDGVPYPGLNSGTKINVGMDIINALSRFYGVSVPLFVDNAESVTHLLQPETQVIRLVVSEEDKELRIA